MTTADPAIGRAFRFRKGKNMKKHLANIISGSRVLCAAALLLCSEFSALFVSLYTYCGFSDLIDGPVARKTTSVSVLGTHLDTAGDVLTYSAMAKILVFSIDIPIWAFIWFGFILAGFLTSAVISKVRKGKFYFVHTLFCKIMGGVFFVLPFVITRIKVYVCALVLCSVSSVAAGESILVQLKSNDNTTNVLSVRKLLKESKDNK